MYYPALVALAVSLLACPPAVWCLRRFGVIDVPNERSSHDRPTPRGGGVAPAIAVVVAVLISSRLTGSSRLGLLAAAGTIGLLGLADDIVSLPVIVRLGAQGILALASLPWLLASLAGSGTWRIAAAAAALLWLVSYVNAFNFMDGVNGMAVAQAVTAGVAWFLVGRSQDAPAFAAAGLIVAAASIGFAPFNVTGRVFLGDVGSYFFGAALGAVAVLGLRAGIAPEAVLAPLGLFLADTGTTIVRRFLRGESLDVAHRDHSYQWLVRNGWSHGTTVLLASVLIAVSSMLGAASLLGSTAGRIVADTALLVVLLTYSTLPDNMVIQSRLISPSSYPSEHSRQMP